MAGTPRPDFLGSLWDTEYLPIGRRSEWREVEVSGLLTVQNLGTADSPGFAVRFYLVEYTGTYQRRLLIATRRSRRLGRYEETAILLRKRLRIREADVAWLQAVIDPGNSVPESDETNNTVESFLPNGAAY